MEQLFMEKQIWKYRVDIGNFTLDIPRDARILTVQTQREQPCIWVLVDTSAKIKETRFFSLYGTGHPVISEKDEKLEYIGTFQLADGSLVFHLFERLLP